MPQVAEGLEALVQAHSREVFGLLMAITRNQATAEEMTQEVFCWPCARGWGRGRACACGSARSPAGWP